MPKNKKSDYLKNRLSPTIQLFGAIFLLVLAIGLSRGDNISSWEATLFRVVYELPDFLFWPFIVITQLGSFYVLGILAIAYLILKKNHAILRLLLTGLLAYVAAGFAKDIWGRGRPFDLLENVVSLEHVVRGPGFPSGHTALATALAFTIGHYLPRKYHWVPVLWIIGVALSRIYLGVHTPVDIIGGFAIGWGAYALFRHVRIYDVSFGRRGKRAERKQKLTRANQPR